ncbi:MAG: recombinase family protein [Candidatus Binataceae bacterium]
MGGTVPLGYDVRDHRLLVNPKEAATVRLIFHLYIELRSVRQVRDELDRRSIVSKQRVSKSGARSGGVRFGRGALYEMLANPIYVGEIRHKRVSHPGQHEAIIERSLWQRVQELLKPRAAHQRGASPGELPVYLRASCSMRMASHCTPAGLKRVIGVTATSFHENLVRGTDKSRDSGWRVSAEEVEHAVMAAARQMISDRGALASTLKACGLAAAELKQALEVVDRKVRTVDEIGSMDEAGSAVERVELKRDGMQITLNLRALLPIEIVSDGGASLRMTHVVQMQMKRRGVETRLVIPGEAVAVSRSDPALLRALSRGYQWFGELASGRVASTRQIAAREGLSHSYVRHVVPLGLFAPKVIEAICAG